MKKIFISMLVIIISMPISYAAEKDTFTKNQICKAGIAKIMGRNPTGMNIDRITEKTIFISYVRTDDRKKFSYKCKINGNRIIWGSVSGRWREHSMDSKVSFKVNGNMITVKDQFNDGSSSSETFTLKQLSN
jgi:hypothetical protein